jgi:Domain of unknown function (DUF5069)
MTSTTLQNPPDLAKTFPRSPNELVGDYILLARILDKCRASIAGCNGEYKFNCPLDRRFFDFFEVNADAFRQQVEQGKTDAEMLQWVRQNSKSYSQEEIWTWAYDARWAVPADSAMKAYFESARRQIAPNHPYIQTWFQLLDAEEGRF